MKKTLKKIACAALAVCSLAVGAFSFTSCTTDRPEVEMKLSFDGKDYTLNYTLYRKYAPNTVNHFLALVENEYYDGLCVHDYEWGTKMYTGAYTYDEDNTDENAGLVYKKYFDTVRGYVAAGVDFPIGVWTDESKAVPTYTLYGEFAKNNVTVENGNFLTRNFGALTMYYTQKDVEENNVYVKKISGDHGYRDYAYNSATSIFSISLTEEGRSDSYCTFATLDDDDKDELQALIAAVTARAAEYDAEEDSITVTKTLEVSEDDPIVGEDGLTETYDVLKSPIVIKYIKVNKY